MEFYAHHGCSKEEQELGGRFSVDIEMQVSADDAITTDRLSATVDYQEVFLLIKEEMQIRSKLLEHLTGRIAFSIRRKYGNKISQLSVEVSKTNPPIPGYIGKVSVRLND